MSPLLQTHDLQKSYRLGSTYVEALRGATLTVDRGEFSAISGPSGSGKTTLLNLLGLLDAPTAGTLSFDGTNIRFDHLGTLHRLRLERLGFIFQTFNLIPVLTAYENVEYPLLLTTLGRRERRRRVEERLNDVGLWEWRHHRPNALSGGQRQRVAIARALVNNPQLILADEPTANIDSATAGEILDLMKHLNEDHHVTFLFSTHDPLVMQRAQRIIRLHDGRIERDSRMEA